MPKIPEKLKNFKWRIKVSLRYSQLTADERANCHLNGVRKGLAQKTTKAEWGRGVLLDN